jgi:hypothetical protein
MLGLDYCAQRSNDDPLPLSLSTIIDHCADSFLIDYDRALNKIDHVLTMQQVYNMARACSEYRFYELWCAFVKKIQEGYITVENFNDSMTSRWCTWWHWLMQIDY